MMYGVAAQQQIICVLSVVIPLPQRSIGMRNQTVVAGNVSYLQLLQPCLRCS